MSRLTLVADAVRPSLKARLMLAGPSGAGKTWTALTIATELSEGGPILGIDTEKESMLTYADDFSFKHLPWEAPYDPRELTDTLNEAGKSYAVIICDSASHFWRKQGGTLDIASGKFTGWKEARPVQERFMEAVLGCQAHVILCVRSKMEHTQEVENGKQVVKKLGMAAQQDDDLEYELNVAIELTMDHTATISKSRTTALPVGRAFPPGRAQEMARIYKEWLAGGVELAPGAAVAALKAELNSLPDFRRVKTEFLGTFGRPEALAASRLTEAQRWVSERKEEAAKKQERGTSSTDHDGPGGVGNTPGASS